MDALERLEVLPGLQAAKEYTRQLVARAALHNKRSQDGSVGQDMTRYPHLVFTGNPGTGKTTVAQLMGEILRDSGLLKKGQVIEISPSDLIAGYIGQTAIKTNMVIDQALDSVLFIDEAQLLLDSMHGGFGPEALDTLLTRMENEPDRLVVIFAGTAEPMRNLINANPGLSRRLKVIDFPDYTSEELMMILRFMVHQAGYVLTEDMDRQLRQTIDGLYAARPRASGNAREIHNLVDALLNHYALRVQHENLSVNEPLRPTDLPEDFKDLLPSRSK